MLSIKKWEEKNYQTALSVLFATLLLIAMNFFMQNMGGQALDLPFNAIVWIFISLIIGLAGFKISQRKQLVWPKLTGLLLLMVFLMFFPAAINYAATDWLSFGFRFFAIMGLVGLFLAFHQFQLTEEQKENLLYVICGSGLIQGIYGILQVHYPEAAQIFPFPVTQEKWVHLAIGIFQHKNALSTYMATVLVISFYLITIKDFSKITFAKKSFLFIVIAICAYTMIITTSRAGIAAFFLGMMVLFSTRIHLLKKNKKLLSITLFSILAIIIAIWQSGVLARFTMMLSNSDGNLAINSYRLYHFENYKALISDNIFLGHGIGRFTAIYQDYLASNLDAKYFGDLINHPHNELLLWTFESGIFALIGLLLFSCSIIYFSLKLGWRKGGAYLALLTPLAFHTQISYPFYISTVHAFIFIFVLFLITDHHKKTIPIKKDVKSVRSLQAISLLVILITSLFMLHTLITHRDITLYKAGYRDLALLDSAENNPYWRRFVEQERMSKRLYWAQRNKDLKEFQTYEVWAKKRLSLDTSPTLYAGLILALAHQNKENEAIKFLQQGSRLYPHDPFLKRFRKNLEKQ